MVLTKIRIMIVDDHPVVRAGLASMLSTQPGIAVVGSASGGQEALALLETVTPDVILMDLRMTGMSGLEAIRAITHQVLQLVAKELTNEEIGQVFGIRDKTARNHVNSIIEKLEVSDRTETATIAMRQGLVSMTD
jgi:DNA-binding NarL/FixJ family response regulator